jgi:hypothetical protein
MRPTKPNGIRKVTEQTLVAEAYGYSFMGLPRDITLKEASWIIKGYAKAVAGQAAYVLEVLINTNWNRIARDITTDDVKPNTFVSTLSNDSIALRLASNASQKPKSAKTISRYLRQLVELGLVCFKDKADRNRTGAFGISLLPAFNRVVEFRDHLQTAAMNIEFDKAVQSALQRVKQRLKALEQAVPAPYQRFVAGVWNLANNSTKLRNQEKKRANLGTLNDVVTRIETVIKSREYELRMSTWLDIFVSPITNKIENLLKTVEAFRDEELLSPAMHDSGEIEDADQEDLFAQPSTQTVKAPKLRTISACVKSLAYANVLPLGKFGEDTDDYDLVQKAVCSARNKLSLPADVFFGLQRRFSHEALAAIVIMAASDPMIRNGQGWVRSFQTKRFPAGLNLQASFMRMMNGFKGVPPALAA